MIILDGTNGEGGGQILRSAIALSIITNKPFELEGIRLMRDPSGLKQQHLSCIRAIKKMYNLIVEGDIIGSTKIKFLPGKQISSNIEIDIETAGSMTLLMQSLLLPAILSKKQTTITLIGGSDVIHSPSFDYFTNILIPHIRKYAKIDVKLMRRGYYPKGNGKAEIIIKPNYNLETISSAPKINLTTKGKLLGIRGISHASFSLEKANVAERQAKTCEDRIRKVINNDSIPVKIMPEYCNTLSDGSGITIWKICSSDDDVSQINPLICGMDILGERGITSEEIGELGASKILSLYKNETIVDEHLVDQLIPFMALTIGSKIQFEKLSKHAESNMYVIEQFLDVKFKVEGNVIEVLRK